MTTIELIERLREIAADTNDPSTCVQIVALLPVIEHRLEATR